MIYQDKSIQCSDCGASFTFSAEQQEFFASKGLDNVPKRCALCRAAKKIQRFGDGDTSYRSRSWH